MVAASSAIPRQVYPRAGGKFMVYGDSGADMRYYGWFADGVCAKLGMKKTNHNLINDGSVEGFSNGVSVVGGNFALNGTGATAVASTDQAKHGTKSVKITAGSVSTIYLSPGLDLGAKRLAMQPGRPYTFNAWIYVPAATTGGTFQIQIFDTDGTGYVSTTVNFAATTNTWIRATVSRTLRAPSNPATTSACECFLRILWTGATAGQVIYVDAMELDTGTWTGAQIPDYVGDGGNCAAIVGTVLQNTAIPNGDASGNLGHVVAQTQNGVDSFATRVAPFTPDMVIVEYGTNDYFSATPLAGFGPSGPYTTFCPPVTPTTWRNAVRTTLANLNALSSRPLIVWTGLWAGTATPNVGLPDWATSIADAKRQMNAITAQECMDAGAIFVPLFPEMTNAMIQQYVPISVSPYPATTTTTGDLVHPTIPSVGATLALRSGQDFIMDRVLAAIGAY